MRLAFAGTPEFAAVALRALLQAGHDVALVLTQPDRPAGRGLKLHSSAVKVLAAQQGVPVAQPCGLRLDGRFAQDAAAARLALDAAAVQAMVVAAYGLILPQWVLDLPPMGCFNIHASLLPRWRGAAPIHRAIEAGDTRTGITIMQMDAGLDTGDRLLEQDVPIRDDDTTGSLHDRLADLGGQLIVQALAAAPLPRWRQPDSGVTYAHKVAKTEAAINWADSAVAIERRLRAFDPFPGATFSASGQTIKLWRARALDDTTGSAPGRVLAAQTDDLRIACGTGSLALLQVQVAGGKRIDCGAFLQAHPMRVGDHLD